MSANSYFNIYRTRIVILFNSNSILYTRYQLVASLEVLRYYLFNYKQ